MLIKVFRPFWSYDVQKTEEWLASMAQKGYQLIRINRFTRYFYFQLSEPNAVTYRIVFDKASHQSLSKGLLDFGWTKVLQCGKWNVTMNSLACEQIKGFPDREGIVKHNKRIMYVFMGMLIYFMLGLFNVILISTLAISISGFGAMNVFTGPYGYIPLTASVLSMGISIFTLYSLLTLHKINRRLTEEGLQSSKQKSQGNSLPLKKLSKSEEKRLEVRTTCYEVETWMDVCTRSA